MLFRARVALERASVLELSGAGFKSVDFETCAEPAFALDDPTVMEEMAEESADARDDESLDEKLDKEDAWTTAEQEEAEEQASCFSM